MAGKLFAMKGGLNHSALSPMQRFFAGKKAVAHHGTTPLHHGSAHVLAGVRHQEFLNQVGMIQEKCISPTEAEVNHISIGPGKSLQILQRTSAKG
jgi:hypothetical protein